MKPGVRQAAMPLAAAAATLLFGVTAWLTAGRPAGIDRTILLALRDPADTALPLGPEWFGAMLHGATALAASATLLPLAIAAAAALALRRRIDAALFVILAIAGGAGVNAVLKALFERTRPELVVHLVEVHTTGFPSGHAFNSAAACVTVCVLLRRAGDRRIRWLGMAGAILFALLAGGSRVYFGVHWPSDVLAGWSAGAAWAWLCALAVLRGKSAPVSRA